MVDLLKFQPTTLHPLKRSLPLSLFNIKKESQTWKNVMNIRHQFLLIANQSINQNIQSRMHKPIALNIFFSANRQQLTAEPLHLKLA